MEEIWKDIEGYEGKYQVSNMGRVRSCDITIEKPHSISGEITKYRISGRILSNQKTKRGYYQINLYVGKKNKKNYRVHRLVAQAFIPNPLNLPHINHINENPLDNRAENLEWCDVEYNNNYGSRKEKYSTTRGRKVEQIDENGNVIATFAYPRLAEQMIGVNSRSILYCCNGKRKTAGGYRWRYADK